MKRMKILVIGNGGREHALAWKIAQSPLVDTVWVAPGNAGTARESKCQNTPIAADDIDGLVLFAKQQSIDLTVVGPEAPLALGAVDRFQAEGLKCFGPSAKAAQLESSKAFSKQFMLRHGIPTARAQTVTEVNQGLAFIKTLGLPCVIKADGLAAGKGVVIVDDLAQAKATLEDMLLGNAFGQAGHRVVIEEFLVGEEASFIVMVSGHDILPMATSQDHKRRDNGDLGPNTGGMGAYSPAPVVTEQMHDLIMETVIRPTVTGLWTEDMPFCGFLYAGIMLTSTGPKVLEFNVRFGDPETQPVLMRLRSDLVPPLLAAVNGTLTGHVLEWDPRAALGVVMAAGGYPSSYAKGHVVHGLETDLGPDVKVFHAGTALSPEGAVVTAGGRVLCVVALGQQTIDAQRQAYEALENITFEGGFYRTDIGHRAIHNASTRTD